MKDIKQKQVEIEALLDEAGEYLEECGSNLKWAGAFLAVMVIAFVLSIFVTGGSLLIWSVGLVAFFISQIFSWQATKWRKMSDEPMRKADRLIQEVSSAAVEKFLQKLVENVVNERDKSKKITVK